jgi:DNA-binding Xre family transcriptional regulator
MLVNGLMYTLKVRQVAEGKNIGIAKLSRLSDVSIISVRKMWRDVHYKPGLDTLEKIAKALDVRIEDILEYTPDDE